MIYSFLETRYKVVISGSPMRCRGTKWIVGTGTSLFMSEGEESVPRGYINSLHKPGGSGARL